MIDLDASIDELGLSARAQHCLQNANIRTIRELTLCYETDLLKIKNFGRKCLREVKEALAEHGLHMKGSWCRFTVPEPFSLDSAIYELGLHHSAAEALRGARIKTVGELIQHTERDLLRLQGIGGMRVKLIKAALKPHGLHLAEEPEKDTLPEPDPVTSSAALAAAVKQLAVATERLVALLEKAEAQK